MRSLWGNVDCRASGDKLQEPLAVHRLEEVGVGAADLQAVGGKGSVSVGRASGLSL